MTDSNTLPNVTKRVSVIGLGNMGSALAEALINAGHEVTVWNRTPSKCNALVEKGASAAGSVAEAARVSDIAIVCVIDYAATEQILHDAEVGQALNDRLLVQVSTMTAEQSKAIALWAKTHGAGYLEGSILGFPKTSREAPLSSSTLVPETPSLRTRRCFTPWAALLNT